MLRPWKNASPSGAVRRSSSETITSASRNSFHVHMNTSTIIVSTAGRAERQRARARASIQLDGAVDPRRLDQRARRRERKNARIQNVPNATESADLRQDQRPVGVGQLEVAEVVVERHDDRLDAAPSARAGRRRSSACRAAEAHQPERVAGEDREHASRARRRRPRRSRSSAGTCAKLPSLPGVGEVLEVEAVEACRSRASSPGVLQRRRARSRRSGTSAISENTPRTRSSAPARARSIIAPPRSAMPVDHEREHEDDRGERDADRRRRSRPAPLSERAVVDLEGRHRGRVARARRCVVM